MGRKKENKIDKMISFHKDTYEFFDEMFHDKATGKRQYGALSDLVNRLLLQHKKEIERNKISLEDLSNG